jgi:hypothetical protein
MSSPAIRRSGVLASITRGRPFRERVEGDAKHVGARTADAKEDLLAAQMDDLTVDASERNKGPLLVLARAERMDAFKGVTDTALLRTRAGQAFAEIVDAVRATKL